MGPLACTPNLPSTVLGSVHSGFNYLSYKYVIFLPFVIFLLFMGFAVTRIALVVTVSGVHSCCICKNTLLGVVDHLGR